MTTFVTGPRKTSYTEVESSLIVVEEFHGEEESKKLKKDSGA